MKAKRLLALLSAVCLGTSLVALAACGGSDTNKPGGNTPGGNEPGGVTPKPEETVYGLPVAEEGRYITNSDVFMENGNRYLVYTTNETAGEQDNVIALRTGTYTEGEDKGWAYGTEKILLRGGEGKWDEFIGSASVVKGTFALGGESYNYLMAYCGTDMSNDTQFALGLALGKTLDGDWVKASEEPLFTADVTGNNLGRYAPSLVNYDKRSAVRLFYTYADHTGHFTRFVDLNAADIGALYEDGAKDDVMLISGEAIVPNNGQISDGGAVPLFPNADFAYQAEEEKFYAVKDYNPAASTQPNFSERLQLLYIAEDELYTVDPSNVGWQSVRSWDSLDTPDAEYKRLYGASLLSDAYGHMLAENTVEIVYSVCDFGDDYLYTQNLLSFSATLSAED